MKSRLNFLKISMLILLVSSLTRAALSIPDSIAQIPFDSIERTKVISANSRTDKQQGFGTEARYVGYLNSRKVHIRVANDSRSLKNLIDEIKNANVFRLAGVLVPEYFGITRLPNGKLGVVSEMIEGNHVNFDADIGELVSRGMNLTDATIEDMEFARTAMNKLLFYSYDGPQFRIRKSDGRAFLIDFEFYESYDKYYPMREMPNNKIIENIKKILPTEAICSGVFR